MERLRRRFPHTLQLLFEPAEEPAGGAVSYASRVRGRTDLEVAEGFVRHVRPGAELAGRERDWLREGLEQVRTDQQQRAEQAG
jgi:exonuclease SbcD